MLYRGVFACEPLRDAFEAASEAASRHPIAIQVNRDYGMSLKPARLFFHAQEHAKDYRVLELRPVSVFISYGGPDQKIAERIHDALEAKGFDVFCFSKDAQPGKPLHQLMFEGVNQADKVVLVCSRSSLNRPGVLNEIEETLRRSARLGGNNALIPLTLDDFVFGELTEKWPDLATRLRDLVIADFRDAQRSNIKFQHALDRLIQSLSDV
jgi:hypothetical protein